MSNRNCLTYWCCYLDADDTKPWYERNNCGKILGYVRLIFAFAGSVILLMVGGTIIVSSLGALMSLIFYAVKPQLPCSNMTTVNDYMMCDSVGMMAFLIVFVTLMTNVPIVVIPLYLVNKYVLTIRNEILYYVLGSIVAVVCAIFAIPMVDNLLFWNNPCTLYDKYMLPPPGIEDSNTCLFRHLVGSMVCYAIMIFICGCVWLCFRAIDCYRNTIERQQLETTNTNV